MAQHLCIYCEDLPILNGPPVGRITRCPHCRALVLMGRDGECHLVGQRFAGVSHGVALVAGIGGVAVACAIILGVFYLSRWDQPIPPEAVAVQPPEPSKAFRKRIWDSDVAGAQAKEQLPSDMPGEAKHSSSPVAAAVSKSPPHRLSLAMVRGSATTDALAKLVMVREAALYGAPKDDAQASKSQAHIQQLALILKQEQLPDYLKRTRPDLAGLPLLLGKDCSLHAGDAKHFQDYAQFVRCFQFNAHFEGSRDGGAPSDQYLADSFWRQWDECLEQTAAAQLEAQGKRDDQFLKGVRDFRASKAPVLQQMIEVESTPHRLGLVHEWVRMETADSTRGLVKRALYDMDWQVRSEALAALEARRHSHAAEIKETLVAAFDYPLAIVHQHAAQAAVHLHFTEIVPALVERLAGPTPCEPREKQVAGEVVYSIREAVRINHHRNCMLCHQVSTNPGDSLRGVVPNPSQPLPDASAGQPGYRGSPGDAFIRADITFLRQDFSVKLPVSNALNWPAQQRFDFLVQTRTPNAAELDAWQKDQTVRAVYRDVIHWVLTELTGQDAGMDVARWSDLCAARAKD
ncbi:MAG: hypothetical protein L0215_06930 [Gemmataceae bacterium]|nr:hypothetical protein [Gemmataceae bacterium]